MEEQIQRFSRLQNRDVDFARSKPTPSWLSGAAETCLNNAQYWSFFDEVGSSQRINRSFLLSAHAGTALFRAASTKEESIQVWLDGPLEIEAFTPRGFAGPGLWLESFYLAIMCRQYDLADQLAAIPIELLVRVGGSDNCYYSWVQTLQAVWQNAENLPTYFEETLYYIDNRKSAPKRIVDLLLLPQVLLCQALLTGDPESFNRELENTLQQHRKFWGTPANKHEPEGFLCLPAIAFSALAHGIGIPITVESSYLLQHQINRPFSKAIPVLQQHSAKQGPANNE